MERNSIFAVIFLGLCLAMVVLAVNAKAHSIAYEQSFKRVVSEHILTLEEGQALQANATRDAMTSWVVFDGRLAAVEARPAQIIERQGNTFCVSEGFLNESTVLIRCKDFLQ